ncbi:S9 family peptidase [Parasphingorhabdus flavimaris]|uniref:S9 family peptidase n=1 Tax=Parasphingorhabdus flavimaris TaxID=266812 RepID=A0ABX2N0G5_9SPHN|nr:S9 family peptidase [Parasphingorhabdus flavimaris]NVD27169.1 S9 family peptidase [Parasphingorhabdus flavimaris]|tara:strand:- start:262 stop:2334 length:2073 start_codon:yes stop_codon:yes gene_type:complete
MKTRYLLAICSLPSLATAAFASDADDSRRFTAERVFDLEYADDPQISPDGSTIVYARKSMDKFVDQVVSDLWSIDTREGTHRPLVSGQGSSSSVRWSPSGDRLIYMASNNGKQELRLRFKDTGDSFSLAQLEQSPGAPVWSPDGKSIAFTMLVPDERPGFAKPPKSPEGAEWAKPVRVVDDLVFRFDGAGYLPKGKTQIFVLGTEGGTPRQVTDGKNGFDSPQWLGNGALLVTGNEAEDADLDPIESEIYRVDLSSEAVTPLTQRDGPDFAPKIAPNGARIAYLGYDDELRSYQQNNVYLMGSDGGGATNLTVNYDRSVDNIAWRPDGKALIGQVEVEGILTLVSIDLSGNVRTLVEDIGGTSLGRPYAAGSFSVASNAGGSSPIIAYTKGSTNRPAEVAISRGGRDGRQLTRLNDDALGHLDLARIEEIKISSSHDGREIEAWVALPPNFRPDGSFPMILEIHGGPATMYGPYFSAEIQRYAAQGYVTVYANPRGSTGYGEDFAQLIDLNYPGNDHDDLMSVVDALIAKNYVSKDRLFITGGSGGGVLTAWAVGKTDRFAAAATIKPVINWTSMALAGDIARFVSRHWFRAQPWEQPEEYWRRSPLSIVNNVKTPTMVMVGEADWRTPAWEAEQFYTALKVQKVDTVLVRVPGASHLIARRPSQLIAKVDNIMGWFAKYDPVKKPEAED